MDFLVETGWIRAENSSISAITSDDLNEDIWGVVWIIKANSYCNGPGKW